MSLYHFRLLFTNNSFCQTFFFSRVALTGPRSVAINSLHPCSHWPLFAIAPTHEWIGNGANQTCTYFSHLPHATWLQLWTLAFLLFSFWWSGFVLWLLQSQCQFLQVCVGLLCLDSLLAVLYSWKGLSVLFPVGFFVKLYKANIFLWICPSLLSMRGRWSQTEETFWRNFFSISYITTSTNSLQTNHGVT